MTTTGVFVSVPSRAAARALTQALRTQHEFATCNVVEAPQVLPSGAAADIATRWASMSYRCRAFALAPAEIESLGRIVRDAPAAYTALARRMIELCIADASFILVWPCDAGDADQAGSTVQGVARLFDRAVSSVALQSVREVAEGLPAQPLVRPSPARLERRLDRTLLTATLGSGDAARDEWHEWRSRVDFDASEFVLDQIGPMLHDNLKRLGVEDEVMARLGGLSRRAWYVNQLKQSYAANAVEELQRIGIDPLVLGDIALSAVAARAGVVRPVRKVEVCVAPADARRAFEALSAAGWSPHRPRAFHDSVMERRNSLSLLRDPGQVIHLHWRAWPARSESLLSPAPDHDHRVALHNNVTARVQTPTRQLLRLWSRSSDPEPGHQLRTICDTAELSARMSEHIDPDQLWLDCTSLGLVEYGEWYRDSLRSIPGGHPFVVGL